MHHEAHRAEHCGHTDGHRAGQGEPEREQRRPRQPHAGDAQAHREGEDDRTRPRHVGSARGTGTWWSARATTSSVVRRCTAASGSRIIRWGQASGAIPFTSSGIT